MKLSREQVEACKKLGRLIVGNLSEEECNDITGKILGDDELYAPLWKNRNRFTRDFLQIQKKYDNDSEQESWITELAEEQFGKLPQDLSSEEKVTLSKKNDIELAEIIRATVEIQDDYKIALRQNVDAPKQVKVPKPTISKNSDEFKEIADFAGNDMALSILERNRESKESLLEWVGSEKDEFRRALMLAVVENSLYKNHRGAIDHANRCVDLAEKSKEKVLEARYIRGRCNWYLNTDDAVEDLEMAKSLAIELGSHVRQAQAAYYLSRIVNKSTMKLSKDDFETLLEEAAEAACRAERSDIELLVGRARLIHLKVNQKIEDGIRLAKEYLVREQEFIDQGNFRIMGNFYVDFALLLRRRFTEDARKKAEGIYDRQIAENRDDQHAGMCRYLKADLYVDRMIEAIKQLHSSNGGIQKWREQADEYRQTALKLCMEARELLESCGDLAGLRKANGRIVALTNQALPAIELIVDVMEDHFARKSKVTELFLGSAPVDGEGNFMPGRDGYSLKQFDYLLSNFFDGIFAVEEPSEKITRSTLDYLREDTMLCIPWRIGNTMVVRVFRLDADGKLPVRNVGWFNLEQYSSKTHDAVNQLLKQDNSLLFAEIPRHFVDLQKRVHTVDAMTLPEKGRLARINHVMIVAPQQNEDWYCPTEWFRTGKENGHFGISLLEMATKSVTFITPVSRPLESIDQTVSNQNATIVVTTQVLDEAGSNDTIADLIRGKLDTSFNIREWDIETKLEIGGGGPCYIIGHNDEQGKIEQAIEQTKFNNPSLIGLIFCSTSRYRAISGPFVDSLGIRLLEKHKGIKLITSRIPVDVEEAMRFLDFLLSYDAFEPGSLVCRYLKMQKSSNPGGVELLNERYNPFLLPWVVIS